MSIKELEHKLDNLSKLELKTGVGKGIQFVQSAAKAGCPTNNSELRESIFTDVQEREDWVTGICYTNKEYGPYVEFGTGPKGQAKHDGISPNVAVAYTQSSWWIHESQIDAAIAEKYHFFSIDTPDGKFYQCTGQPAQPFMYPALKNNEEDVVDIIAESLKKQIGEITK